MSVQNGHAPTVEELQAYSLGKLDPGRAAAVESFLADHPDCVGIIADTPDDHLLDCLRGAGDVSTADTQSSAVTLLPGIPPALADHPRYRLLCKVGEGGMGTVFLAEHRLMGRPVAVKVIRPACLAHPEAVERFRREVHAAAGLSHPNIVTAHDAEEAGGAHFLVMEFVEGVTLDRWLAERGPLPVAEACEYIQQAARGLQHAHEMGMVHRDLKPHNLMRTPDGTVKILDFGLARCVAEATAPGPTTDPGMVMGTADYMAPEQGQDSRTADIRADVYALGCTLYQLLTGRVPFPDGTGVSKIVKHSLDRPEPLRRLRPDLPVGVVRVVEKMMARRPADRYQTPAEVVAALDPCTRQRPPAGRRRWRLLAAAAAVLLLAAVVVYRIQTDRGELVIETDSDDVEVVIKDRGNVVRVVDTRTQKAVTLRSGEYELELKGGEGLKLDIEKATLTRGGRVLARIERAGKAPGKWAIAELPEKVGLIHRFPQIGTTAKWAFPAFSSDGRLIAFTVDETPGDEAYKRIVETATGRVVAQVGRADEAITFLLFIKDNRQMLTGSRVRSSGKIVFRTWDLAKGEGQVLDRIDSPSYWPTGFTVSADGSRLAMVLTSGSDAAGGACVVDVVTGKVLLRVAPPEGKKQRNLFTRLSSDGRRAVTTINWSDRWGGHPVAGRLRLDDLDGGETLQSADLDDSPWSAFFSPDGREVGALCEGKGELGNLFLAFWDARTLRYLRRVDLDGFDKANYYGSSGVVDAYVRVLLRDGKDVRLHLFDPLTGKLVSRSEPLEMGERFGASADGRAAWTGDNTEYRVYRLPDPRKP